MSPEGPALTPIVAELGAMVDRLTPRWGIGMRRMSRKRAAAASLLAIYRDVVIELRHLDADTSALQQIGPILWDSPTGSMVTSTLSKDDIATIWFGLSQEVPHEIKNLYHWVYVVYDFFQKCDGPKVNLRELDRICLFRHMLIVHSARMPFHKAGKVAHGGTLLAEGWKDQRIISHPMWQGYEPLRGKRHRLREIYPYIPGLRGQSNTWEIVNTLYEHYNDIADKQLQQWVRHEVFGSSGLRSDPPNVVASALLDALREYVRVHRL